jgi:hypothetical protein
MSPLPNRSSQSSESPASQPSPSPADQVANPLEPPVENTVDNPPDSATNTAPPASTSESPRLVLKRPVMRPVSEPQPPVSQPARVEKTEAQPEKEKQLAQPSGELAEPLESEPRIVSTDASTTTSDEANTLDPQQTLSEQAVVVRQHPIPAPSEPMQYRAIGLIRGRYTPSEEQFTRGNLLTTDNVDIEAVLLGRVMSLVKNHLDLTQDHLWVVYPRTREREEDLHAQIVGVWEPEKLNKGLTQDEDGSEDEDDDEESTLDETEYDSSETDAELTADDEDEETSDEELTAEEETSTSEDSSTTEAEAPMTVLPTPAQMALTSADVEDNYFSIRGEVIFQSQESDEIIVKIQQIPRKQTQKAKAFKLKLKGTLSGRAVGYFWELHVRREDRGLVVYEGKSIGMIPPKKRKGGGSSGGGGRRKPPFNKGGRPAGGSSRPMKPRSSFEGDNRSPESAPPARRPIPKPVKRREASESGEA